MEALTYNYDDRATAEFANAIYRAKHFNLVDAAMFPEFARGYVTALAETFPIEGMDVDTRMMQIASEIGVVIV